MICDDEPKRPDGLPNVRLVNKLDEKLTREQILFVLETLETICLHCFDNHPRCTCWDYR